MTKIEEDERRFASVYLDRTEQQELLRRRTEEQHERTAATAEERRTRQRERQRQRQRREAERQERNKDKFRWTPAQIKLFDEIERVSRATPEAREVVFWREVERAEGVCFMGRDDASGESRRELWAQDLLDRWREWITPLPWSAREAWQREYLKENPDKAAELDELRRSDGRHEHDDED